MQLDRSKMNDILSIYVPGFFIFVGMGIVSPVLAIYAQSFGVSILIASLAITIYSVGRLVMDFPAGMMADRIGRKPVMVIGTALIAVTAFLNATTDNFLLFLFFRFIQGLGSSMWMTSRTALLADILKPEERGRILGYFQSFQTIGQAAGPTIGGFVATWYGIRANFYFNAAAGVISLILSYIYIREPEGIKSKDKKLALPTNLILRLLKNRGFLFASLATTTAFFLMSGIRQTILPVYISEVAGLPPADIGIILSAATITNIFLTIPIGYGIDLIGRKPIIVVSLFISGFSMFIFPQVNTFILLCTVSLLLGVASSGIHQAPLTMATDASIGESKGISMGLFRVFSDVGSLIGPVLLGAVADGFGLGVPFYVMGVIIFVNATLILFFGEETLPSKKKDKRPSSRDCTSITL